MLNMKSYLKLYKSRHLLRKLGSVRGVGRSLKKILVAETGAQDFGTAPLLSLSLTPQSSISRSGPKFSGLVNFSALVLTGV